MTADVPEALRIGQARLTAGLDRRERLGLASHRAVFGPAPHEAIRPLIRMAERVNLCGRGGAAFPVARKLRAVWSAATDRRSKTVVVVNATEGEPGSLKDRMLLLRSPHLMLDGAVMVADALHAHRVIVAVAGEGPHADSVREAIEDDPALHRKVELLVVPERFVSGESSALASAASGKTPLPPGRKTHASEHGVDGLPTFLSNAETFAQLAVLGMLGAPGYASAGTEEEPGTVLLTVGGSAGRPAVVEVGYGTSLGAVLDICAAAPEDGVLVGGYHGMWLPAELAYHAPLTRQALTALGGTLGAGVVLALGQGSCPLGEAARVTAWLAKESSGQCGPCMLGLPAVARSMADIVAGSGGMEALDAVRRTAAAVRGRGACGHPDGTFNFVMSALDVFADDLSAHMFRGTCGRPVRGILPLDAPGAQTRLAVDWTRCRGHGLCAHVVPELIQLDAQGYPVMLDMPVPDWLAKQARQAVEVCPALALRLAGPPRPAARVRGGAKEDLIVTESWIAELGG